MPERCFGLGSRVCSCVSCVRKPVPATSEANSATPKEEKDDGGKGQPETYDVRGESEFDPGEEKGGIDEPGAGLVVVSIPSSFTSC